MNQQYIEILRATKEHLFEYGWIKGSVGFHEEPRCLVGGLFSGAFQENGVNSLVYCEGFEGTGIQPLVREVAKTLYPDDPSVLAHDVPMYNDAEETNFDDIIDLLDRTIKRLEMEES